MTSVVVSDGGGNIVEYVTVVEEPQQVSLDSLFINSKSLDKKQRSLCCLFALHYYPPIFVSCEHI